MSSRVCFVAGPQGWSKLTGFSPVKSRADARERWWDILNWIFYFFRGGLRVSHFSSNASQRGEEKQRSSSSLSLVFMATIGGVDGRRRRGRRRTRVRSICADSVDDHIGVGFSEEPNLSSDCNMKGYDRSGRDKVLDDALFGLFRKQACSHGHLVGMTTPIQGGGSRRHGRVALFGQLAPACAATYWKYGCALLIKVREMAVPLDNVPKKARNEESLRSTTRKSDTRNSEAPGSNRENTPSLDEGQNPNCKDQEHETCDAKMAGDDADSELNLAWEMLNLARRIVEQKPDDNTMEKAKILIAMAEVSMERGDLDNSLGYYSEALAILEHLVEPDHRRILGINFGICLVLVSASKIGDAIQYCAKAVSLCKSRLLNLKNAVKASLADESANHAFAAEGGSENSTLEDEMNFFAGLVAELEKKLEELEVAKSTPSSTANETLKRVLPRSPVSGVYYQRCARSCIFDFSKEVNSQRSILHPRKVQ